MAGVGLPVTLHSNETTCPIDTVWSNGSVVNVGSAWKSNKNKERCNHINTTGMWSNSAPLPSYCLNNTSQIELLHFTLQSRNANLIFWRWGNAFLLVQFHTSLECDIARISVWLIFLDHAETFALIALRKLSSCSKHSPVLQISVVLKKNLTYW